MVVFFIWIVHTR